MHKKTRSSFGMKEKGIFRVFANATTYSSVVGNLVVPIANHLKSPILKLTSCFKTRWFFIGPNCRNCKGTFRMSTYSYVLS
jgi:hypothetical protein